ncbi:ASCH domain-containing protein [Lysinibacter sp. HNR]|uniref:ASCH domain-containing protein n=1 Tax=Lysinibacter sp. HNR TaxID=3031408 RepID=UPI002435B7EB|nr:ASCH domain-containing protein [Lysinibacter sp. HNR]WGD37385.1 ASCH domain-containing protein [Lysinibacter sp. HNR]
MNVNPTVPEFWNHCRKTLSNLPEDIPETWAFGATPEHADGLLKLVLEGTKTGTASALWDYEHSGDTIPVVGEYSMILDGRGTPRALIEITSVDIVAFNEVSEEHAHAEGEGDRSLASWREAHEHFWRNYSENPRGYEPDMPVVCERFRVLYPLHSELESHLPTQGVPSPTATHN